MIPLVILDIDGTLIGSSGHVEDCVWRAVDKAKNAGMKFAICTGRPGFGVAKRLANRLGEGNPHIFQNGAQVSFASGDLLQVSALKTATSKELIRYAREKNLVLELYTPTNLFVERTTSRSEAHAKSIGVNEIVRDLEDVVENEPVIRAQWVVSTEDLNTALALELEGIEHGIASSHSVKDTVFISITKTGTTKGSAVLSLAENMKLEPRDLMAVGDSVGDVPMFEVVGFPFLMANGPEELKTSYQVSKEDVDNCGVVEAINAALHHVEDDEASQGL